MAEKRMFTKKITETDVFLDMPKSAQCLYFHLNMNGDDEGFVSSPRKIMRMINSSEDDYKILLAKRYLLQFESGICVIKHWKMHNAIRADRFKETHYIEERNTLDIKNNDSYTEKSLGIPLDNQMSTNGTHRLGKVRLEEVRLEEVITIVEEEETFSVKEVIEYLNFKVNRTGKDKYRHTTIKTIGLINARKAEGFTFDEFKTAIDNSYIFWLAKGKGFDNMKPSTIFNGSFENRVNNSAYSYSSTMSNNGNSDLDDMQYLHDKYKAEEEENDKK